MPEDQIWRPLDAKRNGLDCILWISHSQGNGTTPPGNILGTEADALVFLMFRTGTSKGEDQARQKAGLQRYWTVTKWSGLTLGESKLLKVENKFA